MSGTLCSDCRPSFLGDSHLHSQGFWLVVGGANVVVVVDLVGTVVVSVTEGKTKTNIKTKLHVYYIKPKHA